MSRGAREPSEHGGTPAGVVRCGRRSCFCDDCTFCLFGNHANTCTYVRRFSGEEFKPECLNLTVKHPLKITVWSYMAARGVSRLHNAHRRWNFERDQVHRHTAEVHGAISTAALK